MLVQLPPIESRIDFPVATTEPRLAAILDKVTHALGEHLGRRIQLGRARDNEGGLSFAIWVPGESFTGVLASLGEEGVSARLCERAVSSQADQVLHTALGIHLSSLEGSKLSVAPGEPVAGDRFERELEQRWNARWTDFIRLARGASEDLALHVIDGTVVLSRADLEKLPADDVSAFNRLYEAVAAEVKRRNT